MPNSKLKSLAPDLENDYPRSPREKLAGFVVAARTLDKCRAELAETLGEYHFDCPLDRKFFDFTGIDSKAFREKAGEGADDAEMADWIARHSKVKDRVRIITWNNELRYTRPADMPDETQEFLEGYIEANLPANRPVYVWFDVYDIEEGRI